MIPKKPLLLVYSGEKRKFAQKCIVRWEKFCPDYEIIEWNEYNYDMNESDYVRCCYENKNGHF